MGNDLKRTLEQAHEELLVIKRNKRRLVELEDEYASKLEEQRQAYRQLEKENKDVDKITGISIESFVATLLKNRDEKIEKEEFEAIEAKGKYDSITFEVESIESEIEHLKASVMHEISAQKNYDLAFEAKKNFVLSQNPKAWEQVKVLELKIHSIDLEIKEINEALVASKLVKQSTDLALSELKTAKNLGIFDIMGGGMLVTLAKRSRMNSAQELINRMNRHLKTFARELKDVNQFTTADVEIGNYLHLGDWLFDGLFMDLFVQNKITESIGKVSTVKEDIDALDLKLEQMKQNQYSNKSKLQDDIDHVIVNLDM